MAIAFGITTLAACASDGAPGGAANAPTADGGDAASSTPCAAGATCAYTVVACVRAPCPPSAACFASNPCDAVRCAAGNVCAVGVNGQASCVAASPRCGGIGALRCSGKATCVDDPIATCQSATPHPDQDGICVCDVDPASAGCAANESFDADASVCACLVGGR